MGKTKDPNLTLYWNILSPPSMFVKIVCDMIKFNPTYKSINVQKKEHKSDWYLKINPNGAIPSIKDKEWTMNEGIVIVRYIIESRNIKTDLYDLDNLKEKTLINEACEACAEDFRSSHFGILAAMVAKPLILGMPAPSAEEKKILLARVAKSQKHLNERLARNDGFATSLGKVTIADLYYYIWAMICHESGLVKISKEDTPEVWEWYTKVKKIKEVKAVTTKFRRLIKMGMFMMMKLFPCCKFMCTCKCFWFCCVSNDKKKKESA